jgi:hypothetical protein
LFSGLHTAFAKWSENLLKQTKHTPPPAKATTAKTVKAPVKPERVPNINNTAWVKLALKSIDAQEAAKLSAKKTRWSL